MNIMPVDEAYEKILCCAMRYALGRRTQNRNVHQDIAQAAIKLATKEIHAGHWHGYAEEMYYKDGFPCIRWQDGHCAHYNIVKGTVY